MLFIIGFLISLGLRLPSASPFYSYGDEKVDEHRGWLIWMEALTSGLFLYYFPVFTVCMTVVTAGFGIAVQWWVRKQKEKAAEGWARMIREAVDNGEVGVFQLTEECKKEIGTAMDDHA